MEVTGKRSGLGSLRFSMGTRAGFLWHPRELCYGRAGVTAVGRAGWAAGYTSRTVAPAALGYPKEG